MQDDDEKFKPVRGTNNIFAWGNNSCGELGQVPDHKFIVDPIPIHFGGLKIA